MLRQQLVRYSKLCNKSDFWVYFDLFIFYRGDGPMGAFPILQLHLIQLAVIYPILQKHYRQQFPSAPLCLPQLYAAICHFDCEGNCIL